MVNKLNYVIAYTLESLLEIRLTTHKICFERRKFVVQNIYIKKIKIKSAAFAAQKFSYPVGLCLL